MRSPGNEPRGPGDADHESGDDDHRSGRTDHKSGRASEGALAILLHSHMPYVEGFGTWPFGEEWLLEAMATVYVPLVEKARTWAEQGKDGVLTLGLTPVLCDQIEQPAVGERFLKFLREVRRELHKRELDGLSAVGDRGLIEACKRSAAAYEHAGELFEGWRSDLLCQLESLRTQGTLALWTSCATHPVLPLIATHEGLRLQVTAGVESHHRRFGDWEGGFWLPECAYSELGETVMAEYGVSTFCVDLGQPGDQLEALEPVATKAGPVAVPIDWSTIELIWGEGSYPAAADYCDYHTLSLQGQRLSRNGGGPYRRDVALNLAARHARDFVGRVRERLRHYTEERGRSGLVVCALDTELLGHWWAEGLHWLDCVIEEAGRQEVRLVTLPRALEGVKTVQRPLPVTSWGRGKDLSDWDSPKVADFAWRARRAELALVAAVKNARPLNEGAALRAARELLAMQASDWAFMVSRELASDYPVRRVGDHETSFNRALTAVGASGSHEEEQPNARLRGLAPHLSLEPLLEPCPDLGG